MADIINCEKCGRMFKTIGNIKMCSRCREGDDDIFRIVREYIYDNPGATVTEVSEATDVSEKKIIHFLKEGRLETKGDSMLLECEKCGEPIASGRMCNSCNRALTKGLRDLAQQMKKEIPDQKEEKSIGKGMYSQLKKL